MDVEKVSEGPPVDVEVGQVGLAVLGRSHEVHGAVFLKQSGERGVFCSTGRACPVYSNSEQHHGNIYNM